MRHRESDSTDPQSSRTTFQYDVDGRRIVKLDNDGTRTSFSYDNADQQTLIVQSNSGGTVLGSTGYRYDVNGNRTTRIELTARTSWSYDSQNQLLGENRTGTNSYRQTYTYDPSGNRLAFYNIINTSWSTLSVDDLAQLSDDQWAQLPAAPTSSSTTYSYDAANQIVFAEAPVGRTTYVFDANGNQQLATDPTGARTTTTWNFENQPIQYQFPSSTPVTFSYNADNRRVRKGS